MAGELLVADLGPIDYRAAAELQEELIERKRAGFPDVLLLLEHPPVFTLGRAGKEAHLLDPGDIPVVRTRRGGDVTYHGPGQLVAYPLVDLRSRQRRAVHRYLARLEEATIDALAAFGLAAERRPPWTGVWLGRRKIASIGIAVSRGITCHGAALNVNVDLGPFRRIVPCGLAWAEVTSMERELGRTVSLAEVKREWRSSFQRRFGYRAVRELCREDIRIGSRSGLRAASTISGSSAS
jgi:lipoate-protein ligase B